LIEKEESISELRAALLAGKEEEAKQKSYVARAKGNSEREILDVIVDAVNIISDLQELDQYDQARVTSVENAVNASLGVLEEWLAQSEEKFNVKVTVGPVGLKTGALSSLVLSASLRAVGFRSTSLGKTQTALDLLRNSEELRADLVIPLLSRDGNQQVRAFNEAYERGGFKNKFSVIPVVEVVSNPATENLSVARNAEEAISLATEWALKNPRS
jgi:methanogenic corrinoid protein MtbC1